MRTNGTRVLFSNTLDSDGVTFEYQTNLWVNGSSRKITQDTDTFKIPEELIRSGAHWRYLRSEGLPYTDEMAEFEADLQRIYDQQKGNT